ncbi:MAG: PorV/PorQ family protein [Melioribacteraceae bacterium]|nr:PorV/PorQ family protein [Melioribacteraceae bacterium]MCF8266244.1 PorV/PorQ family protein [Melioribacteraceae bacterium]MCF8414476.1 PorV/PorQ family protein [Melioribacteraceae bacterium]
MKSIKLIVCFALLSTITVDAQFNKSGRTVLQFLKIGIGARQVGMSEASIASVQDANSIFWNPAATTGIEGIQTSFTYTSWIADLNIMSGAVGISLDQIGTVSLSYITLDYGDIPEALTTSASGNIDTRTGSSFSGSDLMFGIGIARSFTDKLSIGVNIKYIREDLHVYSSDLWAFDVGSYFDTKWRGIRIAMSAQNFSSQARWLFTKEEEQQTYELPIVYRIGFSIDILGGEKLFLGGDPDQHKLTYNIDAIHTNDYAERLHMGFEYEALNMLFLRGGYRFNYEEGNLSAGIGFKYQTDLLNINVDYAYVQYDFLESPHRVSVSLSF